MIMVEVDHPVVCAVSLTHLFPPADYGCMIKRGKKPSQAVLDFVQQMKAFDLDQDFNYFASDFCNPVPPRIMRP